MLQHRNLLSGSPIFLKHGTALTLCLCRPLLPRAGHGQRRNPYDGITTSEGLTLRQIASKLQPLPEHYTLPESLNKRKSTGKRDVSGATAALAAIADRCQGRGLAGPCEVWGGVTMIWAVSKGGMTDVAGTCVLWHGAASMTAAGMLHMSPSSRHPLVACASGAATSLDSWRRSRAAASSAAR